MARTTDDIELYLRSLERTFDRNGDTFVMASGAATTPIAVHVADSLVLVRVDIGKVPSDDTRKLALFRRLLELNASDLVHGAYGLEGEEVVLGLGLPLENLDLNEFASALADVDLALARHVKPLRDISQGA
ncbi:MAG: CesT family type III secretion system chaperone [Deltaproteobacteria bacterium]|nr:CesT family type III secretion system chaperone [Deltaproteobacteria bacterium]